MIEWRPLCLRAMDPTITDADRRAYNDEFTGLVQNLGGVDVIKVSGTESL